MILFILVGFLQKQWEFHPVNIEVRRKGKFYFALRVKLQKKDNGLLVLIKLGTIHCPCPSQFIRQLKKFFELKDNKQVRYKTITVFIGLVG